MDKGYFGVFASYSLPIGAFGDTKWIDSSGLAGPGMAFGAEYTLPFPLPMVSAVGTAFFQTQFFNKSHAKEMNVLKSATHIEGGSYILIPVLAGVKVRFFDTPLLSLYGQGQFGMNYIRQMAIEWDVIDHFKAEFKPAWHFAFSTQAGIVLGNTFNISGRLLYSGDPVVEYTITSMASRKRQFDFWSFQINAGMDFGVPHISRKSKEPVTL